MTQTIRICAEHYLYSLEYADIWSDSSASALPAESAEKGALAPADLEPGDFVDCKDTVQKWCVARVLKVDDSGKQVWVHFEGWQVCVLCVGAGV